MPAQVPKRITYRILLLVFTAGAGSLLASCATKEQPPLVDDPNGKRESTMPWNKQEKWEQGNIPGLTDRPH